MTVINTSRYDDIDTLPIDIIIKLYVINISKKGAISLVLCIINKTVTVCWGKNDANISFFYLSLLAASLCCIQLYVTILQIFVTNYIVHVV